MISDLDLSLGVELTERVSTDGGCVIAIGGINKGFESIEGGY